jgi:hypothetical protein
MNVPSNPGKPAPDIGREIQENSDKVSNLA